MPVVQQADAYLPALLVWVKAVLIQGLAWQVANQDLVMIKCAHARCVAQEVIEPALQHMRLRCKPVHKIHAYTYLKFGFKKMQHADLQSRLAGIYHCMQV